MSISALLNIVVYLIVIGAVCWLILWLVDYVGLPEPFRKIAKIIVAVIAVLIVINVLLGLVGSPIIRW